MINKKRSYTNKKKDESALVISRSLKKYSIHHQTANLAFNACLYSFKNCWNANTHLWGLHFWFPLLLTCTSDTDVILFCLKGNKQLQHINFQLFDKIGKTITITFASHDDCKSFTVVNSTFLKLLFTRKKTFFKQEKLLLSYIQTICAQICFKAVNRQTADAEYFLKRLKTALKLSPTEHQLTPC